MRWEEFTKTQSPPTFRTNVELSDNICFAALRLRAKLAMQTDNPTHVPPETRGGSDSNPAS